MGTGINFELSNGDLQLEEKVCGFRRDSVRCSEDEEEKLYSLQLVLRCPVSRTLLQSGILRVYATSVEFMRLSI